MCNSGTFTIRSSWMFLQISENTDSKTDLLKTESGCVVDANINSKVKEFTATGNVIIFCVCLTPRLLFGSRKTEGAVLNS